MSVAQRKADLDQRPKVLVVDDEPFNLEIMQEILDEHYQVLYAKSGDECLEMAPKEMPDVVLLDVNMPGMSGYEVCLQLKDSPRTMNIPVTFVSALDTLAERLAGYEVGGDDYICKPFEANELRSKVSIAVKYKRERESLKIDAERAMNKAIEAMKNTTDLGIIVDFLRSSLSCDDPKQLADMALFSISSMGLRSSVQIRVGNDIIHKSSDGAVNQLERTVVKKIYQEDAVVDFGNRTVFNFEHASVLIKNMPLDDDEKYARVKENISLLTEGLETRVRAIVGNMVSIPVDIKNFKGVDAMAQQLQTLLGQIETKTNEVRGQYVEILSDLSYKIEGSFSSLGLTEYQEQMLMELVDNAINEAHNLHSHSEEIESQIFDLVEEMRNQLKSA